MGSRVPREHLPDRIERESSVSFSVYLGMCTLNCGVVVENNLVIEEELVDEGG